ncbi:MAG TPA: superoxide dismutase family protein [Luteimonas sp.]|nr:superoxide dismutase family protein [Luteimonas sp.]
MRKTPLLLLPAALLIAACQPQAPAEPEAATPTPAPEQAVEAPAPAATASVALAPTEGNATAGAITFELVDGGIRATGEVTGLSPGDHGFHVHEHGDCSAPDGTSAGGHFNPGTSNHGRVGHGVHHGGDSDNIFANDAGVATVDSLLQGVTLGDGAATDIVGKAVIVHADPDDYTTQPTGNAGARLACGVIAAQ